MSPKKTRMSARHKARRHAVQAIYQWMFSQTAIPSIIHDFENNKHFTRIDRALFENLVWGVSGHQAELDSCIKEVIDCSLDEMTSVELAVLRLAVYEMLHCPATPYRVIINEALELTKLFGTDQGYRFVNGVLDKLAHNHRGAEISLNQSSSGKNDDS